MSRADRERKLKNDLVRLLLNEPEILPPDTFFVFIEPPVVSLYYEVGGMRRSSKPLGSVDEYRRFLRHAAAEVGVKVRSLTVRHLMYGREAIALESADKAFAQQIIDAFD